MIGILSGENYEIKMKYKKKVYFLFHKATWIRSIFRTIYNENETPLSYSSPNFFEYFYFVPILFLHAIMSVEILTMFLVL